MVTASIETIELVLQQCTQEERTRMAVEIGRRFTNISAREVTKYLEGQLKLFDE
jgi:hypothetical protein